MQNDMDKTQFFCEYYKQWIEIYKRGAIREATMAKYLMTQKWLEKLIPELKVEELTITPKNMNARQLLTFIIS